MMNPRRTQPAVHEVDPQTAHRWIEDGEAVLIDVREPHEHQRERISGAALAPLSRFDPAAVPAESEKRVIMHCHLGQRSLAAAERFAAAMGVAAYSIAGGIEAWKRSGLPVEGG